MLGTFHAMEALARGCSVVHFESSAEPQAATPRSPGALSFSRAAPGLELDLCLESARRWSELAQHREGLVRHLGSTVVATDEGQDAVLRSLCGRADARERGWEHLDAAALAGRQPLLAGAVVGALRSELDLVVEPRHLLEHLRETMSGDGRYRFAGGVDIRDVAPGALTDQNGRVHRGDLVVLCPGSRADLGISLTKQPSPLRAARIQVVQTERMEGDLGAPVSDLAALASSPLGRATAIEAPGTDPRLGSTRVALTCVQRRNRTLTIGETRDYDEPFGFEVSQRPIAALLESLRRILGTDVPPLTHQWAGQVRHCADGRLWLREDLDEATTLVTCADQRGITLAPVIAADTFDWVMDGTDSGATHPGADGASAR